MQNLIIERIVALRKEMEAAGVKAVILPRTDAHLSEYISSHWHIVRYLSGFTGTAGTMSNSRTHADKRICTRLLPQYSMNTAEGRRHIYIAYPWTSTAALSVD